MRAQLNRRTGQIIFSSEEATTNPREGYHLWVVAKAAKEMAVDLREGVTPSTIRNAFKECEDQQKRIEEERARLLLRR